MYNKRTSKIKLEGKMNKDKMRRMCCVLLVLCLALAAVGCGGEDAPQSYEYYLV